MAATRAMSPNVEPLKVYWQPGCTGCLRMKEFLTQHGVDYISINVLVDDEGRDELARLAGRRIPIARRGDDWVDGQILSDLARIAGITWGAKQPLAASELAVRVDAILSAVQRFARQIPDHQLDNLLPDRPRTYRQLVAHIVQIFEAFLDLVENGKRLEFAAYNQDVPPEVISKEQLLQYVEQARQRFDSWWRQHGKSMDFTKSANVYYGQQTLHEYYERSTWHAGQHTRQLQLVVERLGIVPDRPLTEDDLAGLPLPTNVWDDELTFEAVNA